MLLKFTTTLGILCFYNTLMKKRCYETTLSGNRTLGMTMKPIGPQSKNLFTFMANLGPNTN